MKSVLLTCLHRLIDKDFDLLSRPLRIDENACVLHKENFFLQKKKRFFFVNALIQS